MSRMKVSMFLVRVVNMPNHLATPLPVLRTEVSSKLFYSLTIVHIKTCVRYSGFPNGLRPFRIK